MEVSALKYSGGIGLHGRTPLLRLQSDERLVGFARRGNAAAFEVLVSRYSSRLLAFCRHLLGSREDAEDVLQEVLAAAYNAMLADDRPINVRPWLYRIARNRCLNHLRRIQSVGVDSMDIHFSDHGASTADKVHEREEFKLLVGDIHELPETQKTALVLREMDALSYEQIAEAMETTVPSVKSLLVRARVSLAEAAEARLLSCDEVRIELGEVAEGLRRKPSPLVRRHLKACKRCASFRVQLKQTNKALAALMPIGPLVVLKKLVFGHIGHSTGTGAASSSAGAAGTTAAGGTAAGSSAAAVGSATAGSTILAGSSAGGFVSAGVGALATKAAAGLAAAALVTAGAVEVDHAGSAHNNLASSAAANAAVSPSPPSHGAAASASTKHHALVHAKKQAAKPLAHATKKPATTLLAALPTTTTWAPATTSTTTPTAPTTTTATTPPARTQTSTDPTVLPTAPTTTLTTSTPPTTTTDASSTTTTPTAPTTTTTPITTTTPGGDTPGDPGSTTP